MFPFALFATYNIRLQNPIILHIRISKNYVICRDKGRRRDSSCPHHQRGINGLTRIQDSYPSSLFISDKATLTVPCPVLESPVQGTVDLAGVSPAKDHTNNQKTEALLLRNHSVSCDCLTCRRKDSKELYPCI